MSIVVVKEIRTVTIRAVGIQPIGGGTGDVVGPASSTDNAIARYNLATGKLIQNSGITIDDSDTMGNLSSISFNTAAGVSVSQGEMAWNADEETLDVGLNGAILQLGQETHYHVRNNTGVQIDDGTPVMASGTIGASGRITITPMVGSSIENAKFYLGITTEDIADSTDGKVTPFGKIRGITTDGSDVSETWLDGDVIWVDPVTTGELTNIEPTTGIRLPVAFVINAHASNGVIFARSTPGNTFSESHDVSITSVVDGEILRYDGTNWINNTLAEAGIGGGGNHYRWSGVLDSPSAANWIFSSKVSTSTNLADEYQSNTGVAKGGNLTTLSFQSNYRIFATVNKNETIDGCFIHCPHGILPEYVGMVVCRGGLNGTTFQYDTQNEILNKDISGDIVRMETLSIALIDFNDLILLDGDVIYLFWATTTTSDVAPVTIELTTTDT